MTARIGAHITADSGAWGFDNQVRQLQDMAANTCRLQMFTGGYLRFSDPQIDQLFAATSGPEFIMQSSELVRVTGGGTDPNGIEYQWARIKWWSRRYPNRHITFEIGNEPNEPMGRPITVEGKWAESPEEANRRLMQCYNHCAGSKPYNVTLAVNNVSGPQRYGEEFFNRFNLNHGYGSPIHNVDIVTIHAYADEYQTLCLHAPNDPLKVMRWVRSWNPYVIIKVTEAGIHTADRHWRAQRYVEFAQKLQRFSNELGGSGPCDSVCFYFVGWDSVVPDYRINETDTYYIRNRFASNDCG